MKTGIILLNYNDAENTLQMVQKIKDFSSLDVIVIVDNCSTDGETKELKALENEKIVFLEARENKGYGAGNNIGLKYLSEQTDCSLVIISNPDISVEEDVIVKMKKDFQEHSDISFLGPVVSELGEDIKGWKLPTYLVEVLSTMNFVHRFAKKLQRYPESYYQKGLNSVEAVHGSFFMARLCDFQKIGFFDENTFLYYEENIIGKKARLHNLSIFVDTQVKVVHALSKSVDKSLNKIRKYKILKKSMFYYEKKYNRRNFVSLGFLKLVYYCSLLLSYLIYWI